MIRFLLALLLLAYDNRRLRMDRDRLLRENAVLGRKLLMERWLHKMTLSVLRDQMLCRMRPDQRVGFVQVTLTEEDRS